MWYKSCFDAKKGDKPLSQYYTDFMTTFEELRLLFLISIDLKKELQ